MRGQRSTYYIRLSPAEARIPTRSFVWPKSKPPNPIPDRRFFVSGLSFRILILKQFPAPIKNNCCALTALNLCLDWKRDHRPTEPWDEEALVPGGGAPASPETIALRRLQIVEALGALPPERRAILLLKEREGWSAAEIGAAMGWNPKRVYNELYQARCTLIEWQAQVEEEGTER